MTRDLTCVYTAATIEQADVIVAWLAQHGIEAYVKDRHLIGMVPWVTPAVAPRGVEVIVADPGAAERATRLLAAREATSSSAPEPLDRSLIDALCEECGLTSSFPYSSRGKVEECPHCGAYVDVPEAGAYGDQTSGD